MGDGPTHRDKEISQYLLIADKAETPTTKDRGRGSVNIQITRTVPQWILAPSIRRYSTSTHAVSVMPDVGRANPCLN